MCGNTVSTINSSFTYVVVLDVLSKARELRYARVTAHAGGAASSVTLRCVALENDEFLPPEDGWGYIFQVGSCSTTTAVHSAELTAGPTTT